MIIRFIWLSVCYDPISVTDCLEAVCRVTFGTSKYIGYFQRITTTTGTKGTVYRVQKYAAAAAGGMNRVQHSEET